jgi:hypothetical protein
MMFKRGWPLTVALLLTFASISRAGLTPLSINSGAGNAPFFISGESSTA